MSRYREVADSLRDRIQSGEFAVGSRLPGISALMNEYDVPSLGTIRAAQRILVEDGMLVTRQGSGAYVTSSTSLRDLDVDELLADVRQKLGTALSAMSAQRVGTVTLTVDVDDTYDVLTEALNGFARQLRDLAATTTDPPDAARHRARADTAEALLATLRMQRQRHATGGAS